MKYCVICAGGFLPFTIASNISKKYELELILIDGFFDDERLKEFPHKIFKIGHAGKIINHMKSKKVTHVIIIGTANMPNFSKIIPDLRGAKLIAKILLMKNRGDDKVLKIVANELQSEGILVVSPKKFLHNSIIISKKSPNKNEIEDIQFGVSVLKKIAGIDLGQGIVVCEKRIIALEAIEGTDEMIKRSGEYIGSRFDGKPILIKIPKTTQDLRLDTPTIGPITLDNLVNSKFAGLAVDLKNTIIVDPTEFQKKLDESGLWFLDLQDIP